MMTTRKQVLLLLTIATIACLSEGALSQVAFDLDGLLGRGGTGPGAVHPADGGTLSFPRQAADTGKDFRGEGHTGGASLSWGGVTHRGDAGRKQEKPHTGSGIEVTYTERPLELTPVGGGSAETPALRGGAAGKQAGEEGEVLDQAILDVIEEVAETGTQSSNHQDSAGVEEGGEGIPNTSKLEALDAVARGAALIPPPAETQMNGAEPSQDAQADSGHDTENSSGGDGDHKADQDGGGGDDGIEGVVQVDTDNIAGGRESQSEGEGGGTGAVEVDLVEDLTADRVDTFVEKIRRDPEIADAARVTREECGNFSLEYYLAPSERGDGAASIKLWTGNDDLVFTVVPSGAWGANGQAEEGGTGCPQPKCGGGGGVVPDGHRALREALSSKVAIANADLARGGLLAIAERLARQEVDSLRRALDFEESKMESGTGLVAKTTGLRAQIAAAESDLAWVRREGNGARSRFEEATGLPFADTWESVKHEQGLGGAWADTEGDVNFSEIFKLAATVTRNNDEGARLMQNLAGEVVAGVGRANRQKGVSNLADEALRKTREAFDSGRVQGGGVSEAEALLLRSQRAEVEAMTGLAVAKAAAYPPLTLEVLSRPHSLPWAREKSSDVPSWVPMAGATLTLAGLALAVIFLLVKTRRSGT